MLQLILKRLISSVPTLIGLTLAVFLLIKAVPGDPAQLMLGERATADALAQARHDLGLDLPIHVQYANFLENVLLRGDLGRSLRSQESVAAILREKFPATIELACAAMFFATLVGLSAGLLGAFAPGSFFDFASMSLAVAGVSMPIFWLALILIWIFGVYLGWLPLSGRLGIEDSYDAITGFVMLDALWTRNFELAWSSARHLVLPACALATIPTAIIARMTRSSMLEVLGQDYIRTASAKGVSRQVVYLKHALKNAFIPILTILGLQFGTLLGGAIITETIFSWPGIGSWLLESVASRDYPALQGGVLAVAVSFVFVNLGVDLLYRIFDPRIRVE